MDAFVQILPNILLWGITTVGAAVIGFLATKFKKFNTDYHTLIDLVEDVKNISTKIDNVEDKVDTIESNFESSRLSNDESMRALLYDRIMQACKYHIAQGFCPIEEKRNIHDLYIQYHNRGGNGLATKEVEKVLELPDLDPNA